MDEMIDCEHTTPAKTTLRVNYKHIILLLFYDGRIYYFYYCPVRVKCTNILIVNEPTKKIKRNSY